MGQSEWANRRSLPGSCESTLSTELKTWLEAAAIRPLVLIADETVPHCKLTDLSLGGCYVQTDAPFPERALVDLCLKTE